MTDPAPSSATREPARFLSILVAQLERDRRAFLLGNVAYVAANLVLAAVVWIRTEGGVAAWLPAGIAFLGNVFYVLNAEWELRWERVWRRELPRLEREAGESAVSRVIQDPGPRRVARGLKWTSWGLTAAWLVALLLTIRASGLDFKLGS